MEKATVKQFQGLSWSDLDIEAGKKYFMARDILHLFNNIYDLTALPEGVGGHALSAAIKNLDELYALFQVAHGQIKKAA
jgi:hypothetical protein